MNQVIVTTHEELRSLLKTVVQEAISATKAPTASDKWLSRKETANYLGIGSTKLNSIMHTDPTFPKRHTIGKKIFYLKSELDIWRKESR